MTGAANAVEAMADRAPTPSDLLQAEGWASTPALRLLDFEVAVHSNDSELLALVEELFEPLMVPGDPAHALLIGAAGDQVRPTYFVAADEGVIVRSPARTVAFAHLMFELNQRAISHTKSAIKVHAAAAVVAGRAVVLPGPMGAGKSTLVAGLVRRGLPYLTDEVVAIDPDSHTVRPYPRPCSLGVLPPALDSVSWSPSDAGARYLGASGFVPALRLGTLAPEGVPVGSVVLPRYDPSSSTAIRRLDATDALVGVASHTFALDVPGTLASLAAVLDGVPCYELVSGDLDEAVAAVLDVARPMRAL